MSLQYIRKSKEAEAESFLKGELSKGMTLAQLVLPEIDFTQGQLFTWLRPETDQDAIEGFEESLRMSGDELRDFRRFVGAFIKVPHCALILQDTENWNFEGDKYEKMAAKYNDELYWHIMGELSEEDVGHLLGMPVLPYPWCGFFYTSAFGLKPTLTRNDLQEIAKTTVGVAVNAFDNGSYVLWWRNSRPLPAGEEVRA